MGPDQVGRRLERPGPGRPLANVVPGAVVHDDCVAAYEDASKLLADLGHEIEDVELPFGSETVPKFELLWYSMATLAPIEPEQERELLPLTRYLRDKGLKVSARELIFAQAYLQGVMRPAVATLNRY